MGHSQEWDNTGGADRSPEAAPDAALEAALQALQAERDPLRVASALRRQLGEARGRFASELRELRRRARGRLPEAERLWLDAKGLEQASALPVALARARHVAREAPGARLCDATAGLGGDAMAFVREAIPTVAADRDPACVRRLRHNLALVGGREPWVVRAAAETRAADCELVALDPDRRAGGARGARARARDHRGWSPGLGATLERLQACQGGVVKLPPVFDPDAGGLRPAGPHRWEWVSLRGEGKELTLWTGRLAGGGAGERSALVLRGEGEGEQARLTGAPPARGAPAPALESLGLLAEADPAVVRAGLTALAGAPFGLVPLADGLGYLGRSEAGAAGQEPLSPFLRAWRVLGSEPLDRRRVRRLLARFDVGPLVVKSRGVGTSAQALAERLQGGGRRRGLLVVLGVAGERRAFLVDEQRSRPPENRPTT